MASQNLKIMDEHRLNQILKNQLEDFEASPSEDAWGNIQKELKRERKIIFHERLSALLILLFLGVTTFLMVRQPLFQSNKIANEDKVEEQDRQKVRSEELVAANPTDPGDSHSNKRSNNLPSLVDNSQLADYPNVSTKTTGDAPLSSVMKLPMKGYGLSMLTIPEKKPDAINSQQPLAGPETLPPAEEPILEKKASRFELFAMAMPSLFYHDLQTNRSDNLIISNLEERSAISSERMGYKTAFGSTFRYRKNLEFSAGLIYAWANESFNFTETTVSGYKTTSVSSEGSSFMVVPEFTENNRTVNFRRQELGLQLGASLLLRRGKIFEQSIGGNFAFHRNLINEVQTDFGDDGIRLNNHFSYVSVFYKLDYRLSRQFDLTLQPTFNYSSRINESDSSPIYIKPNNLSINFGIAYRL